MNNITLKYISITMISLFIFNSCEEIFDCMGSVKIMLPNDKELNSGTVGKEYLVNMHASAKNTNDDDRFDYTFDIEDGSLPDGIQYKIDNRFIEFYGVPTKAGTFTFLISGSLENNDYYDDDDDNPPFSNDNVCFDSSSTCEEYTIKINK